MAGSVNDMEQEILNEELENIISCIKAQYDYDFGGYAEASLKRRILRFCQVSQVSLYELKYQITNDKSFFFWFLESLTVNTTEMFRDPLFFKALAATVFPVLNTYPIIKIWHAGCSTGEEAYSLAIMLHEAGLLERCKIYATDINMGNIGKAASGIIPLNRMKDYTSNYIQAGGTSEFSNYYTARYDNAIISKELRKNIIFSQHNLVTDSGFNEFQLICCRNVLIYFKSSLQNRVIRLFYNSLSSLGYLALGSKESLLFSDCINKFDVINRNERIFRLKNA